MPVRAAEKRPSGIPEAIDRDPILVLGCGSMGRKRLRFLKRLGAKHLIAVDQRPERCQEVENRFQVETMPEFEEALSKRSPRIVFIATPTAAHLEPALMAARQGCHLLIEKPLGDRLEGVDSLIEVLRDKRLKGLVGCNLRFHPSLRLIKKWVSEGRIGRVVSIRFQSGMYLPDWHPWEDYRHGYSANRHLGGGVILDGIQAIDFVMGLVESPVREVFSFAGTFSDLEIDTEDTAEILLRFEERTVGEVHLDYVQRVSGGGCQVIGAEGTILWDTNDKAVRLYTVKSRRWETFPEDPQFDYSETFVEEMQHFFHCIVCDDEPCLDLSQAKRVLEVALTAKEASEKGRCIRLSK